MKFPMTVPLLPGLRWQGKMRIVGPHDDGYAVEFDAEAPKADPLERFVFDHAVLTAKQVCDWTGIELEAKQDG